MSQKSRKTDSQESHKPQARRNEGGGRGIEATATIIPTPPDGQTTPPPTDDK